MIQFSFSAITVNLAATTMQSQRSPILFMQFQGQKRHEKYLKNYQDNLCEFAVLMDRHPNVEIVRDDLIGG